MSTRNPATEELLVDYPVMGNEAIEARLAAASAAFSSWRKVGLGERAQHLRQVAASLRARADVLASAISTEMGKPVEEARAELDKSAFCCEFYADSAARFLASEPCPSDTSRSYVAYRPLGVVLGVMPWNFPVWQVVRAVAPILVAGNTFVLKHATNVTGCALLLDEVLRDACLPSAVFSVVVVPGSEVARLIEDPRIQAVTLTGSDHTGSAVARVAGGALKRCVLELGGSDAFIVLDDADIEQAAAVGAASRFHNAGQSCGAAKRFIVVESVADAFEGALAERAEEIRVGDPLDPETQMGPLARADIRVEVQDQVRRSLLDGAALLTGGGVPRDTGYFLEPTVLTNCDATTTAFREETFGPVAAIARVADLDAAVDLANASEFGLGGAVWTSDIAAGEEVAARLDTGGVFINGFTHSDPRRPFGGVKRSGYGRELGSFGIREFVNVQSVWRPETPDVLG